jgi:ElaB/YqjD/DUF883 family membrane-anchored ribosome-binding protein
MANQESSAASKEFDKASSTIDEIEHDLQVMRDDVTRLAQQVAGLLSTAGSEALREVKAHMNRAKQGLGAGDSGPEAVDAFRDTTASAVGALEDIVHKRPFATLAIAIGLGFLFGATWRS